jgi:hypothetical protein
MQFKKYFIIISLVLSISLFFLPAEEGMWPIHEINRLDLAKLGFSVTAGQIFRPGHTTLSDAIVNLSGGTGSFVSANGLIITNHHVAFSAIQRASSTEHDYVTHGFLAKSCSEEIPAAGYTVRIIESCRDVSADVLNSVQRITDFSARTKAIEKKTKHIILAAETKNPGKRAEVAEMFPGKSYMLFIYIYLKDVRLVYAPPLAIGNFGGETDNWVWPRHTGDFTFLRAYTAANGQPADYAKDNIPYTPRSFLKIATQGINEGDRVFMLGYPGRTYRHLPASFLAYEQNLRLPYIAALNQWQINEMEKRIKADPALMIPFASRIKRLANTMKNYQPKISGLKKLQWLKQKEIEENRLTAFIQENAQRKKQYADIIPTYSAIYREMSENFSNEILLEQLPRVVNLLQIANTVVKAAHELQKKDIDRDKDYMDRNFDKTKERLLFVLKSFQPDLDACFLQEMISRHQLLPNHRQINALYALSHKSSTAIKNMVSNTCLTNSQSILDLLKKKPCELQQSADPFIRLALDLFPSYQAMEETKEKRKGQLDQLAARLSDIRQQWLKTDFIPDANGTLRLTYGTIHSYNPYDAVTFKPFTTIGGILEKEDGTPDFMVPALLKERYAQKEFGSFVHPQLNDVPVAMLYDMDTTGGNSGSPVFNTRGELVGINFDRALQATINDFAWNTEYSRSIAVDMRYVLWVTRYIAAAEHLLQELGID